MIRISICDDEKTVLNEISGKIQLAFENENCQAEIFKTANPFELLEHIKHNDVDVLFLDIDMPSLNGMDIAQFLIDSDIRALLIFVTSHDALVYQSFRYHPFGFIRKSYFDEEIGSVVKSITDDLQKKSEYFSCKTNEGLFRFLLSDILYFESESNYINLHCKDKVYKFRSTITALEKELSSKGFIRTHKGFLVNQQHIFAIRGDNIELSSKVILPIGRTNRDSVKKTILRYMR
ncbi:MAG: response regulator transcription factor [Clostridia bacterium]|nr:response regulator transcription factor [Clostridia bacterium]